MGGAKPLSARDPERDLQLEGLVGWYLHRRRTRAELLRQGPPSREGGNPHREVRQSQGRAASTARCPAPPPRRGTVGRASSSRPVSGRGVADRVPVPEGSRRL